MTKYPNSIDTARPIPGRQSRIWLKLQLNMPAERNTICIVNGTENANTQLFIRDPEVRTSTCNAQLLSGTCRGFKRGKPPLVGNSKKEGRE